MFFTFEELKDCLSGNDIGRLAGADTDDDFPDTELTQPQWFGLQLLCDTLSEINEELESLEEQYPGDSEVAYVVETCRIETPWYALMHKFDVESYLGKCSTMAGLVHALKAANILLSEFTMTNCCTTCTKGCENALDSSN